MQILEARASLAYESKKQSAANVENLPGKNSSELEKNVVSHHEEPLLVPASESGSEKASLQNVGTSTAPDTNIITYSDDKNEIKIFNKSITEEKHVDQVKNQHSGSASLDVSEEKDEDDADDWLKEETSENGDDVGKIIPIENEEDVSFSDLEDDDVDVPTTYRKSNYSSDKESRDWVQLGKSSSDAKETKESNDWLDVDDIVVS